MAATFVSLTPVTLTSGSPTKVSQTQIYAASVIIYADSLNTGNAYMGGSNVTVSNGIPIAATVSNSGSTANAIAINVLVDYQ